MDKSILNDIVVANLADEQQYIEEVSRWIWEEWSKEGGATLDEIIYRTKHSICKDKVPQMLIAKLGDELVGTVSIWHNDLTTRQDLTPWLAALYIKKEYRSIGLGKLLQDKTIELVRSLGYEKLYLITHHDDYYEKTGWKFIERAPNKGGSVKVYEYTL